MDDKIECTEKEVMYFDRMINGAERLVKPWKTALIACIIGWALTLIAFIFFAYWTPTEISQNQDIPNQTQSQEIKGVN